MKTINLYVDDERPAPEGWKRAYTVDETKEYLQSFQVDRLSLDHDLGGYPLCTGCTYSIDCEKDPDECRCKCHGIAPTGYDLVKWMADTNTWPASKPTVHSMNPVGAANMRLVIDRYGPYNKD